VGCLINCDSFRNREESENMQLEKYFENKIEKITYRDFEKNINFNNDKVQLENNSNINEIYNTKNNNFPLCQNNFNIVGSQLNNHAANETNIILKSLLNADSSVSEEIQKCRKSKSLMVIENISVCVSTQDFQLENYAHPHSPIKNTQEAFQPMFSTNYSKIPHDYILDIWETLKSEEELNKSNYYSILKQKDINEKMRAILVDWLVEVHCKFKLRSETLFLTINLIDRYLSFKQVLRTKLQLVGVAALLVACKYEEVLCPDIRDFVYVTDRAYSKEEILQTELDILLNLKFEVTLPSPLRFFEIIALNFNFNLIEFTYGNYLLEFFLVDTKMNKYPASIIALAAAYIVMKMNNHSNYKELYNLFNHSNKLQCVSSSKTLKDCAREMFYLVENVEQLTKLQAVYNKFSQKKFFCVAKNENCFSRSYFTA
jgi:hypothetical protein